MAGPTVTLTFEGEEKDLTQAIDNVGNAFGEMEDQIGRSSKNIRSHTGAFDKMAEGTDNAERRFTGFYDTIGGTTDALAAWNDESLSTTEKLVALGQAGADLAGGLTEFVIPAISSLTTFLRGGLASAMSFIAAHPLMIALIALAAVFVLLWTNSETFRNIVMNVFEAVGNFIKNVFGGAIDWVVGAWNWFVGIISNTVDWITRALSGIGSAVGNAFKGALNVAIDILNWFVDRANNLIYGINLVNPFNDIPYIPHIARLQTGGRTTRDGLAFLHQGETVRSAAETDRGGNSGKVEVVGDVDTFLYKMIKEGQRTGKLRFT